MNTDRSQLREYLAMLRRRWLLMLAVFVTVVLVALLFTLRTTPVYQAETQLELQPLSTGPYQASQAFPGLVGTTSNETQVQLIQSDAVLQVAAKNLGLASGKPLKGELAVSLVPNTEIVSIAVRDVSPKRAADWANGIAIAYIEFRQQSAIKSVATANQQVTAQIANVRAQMRANQAQVSGTAGPTELNALQSQLGALETELASLPGADILLQGGGTIIAPAQIPTRPARPNKTENLILAAVVGLVLAAGVALLAESLDDRVRTSEEVERRTGAPVLGRIPRVRDWTGAAPHLATVDRFSAGAAEAYRTLRTNLRFVLQVLAPKAGGARTILVTSSVADEGKSTTAANLAATFAQGGVRTVLISGDLRKPTVHRYFELTDSIGLVDALRPEIPIESVLQANKVPNFKLLAAGKLPPNPSEILSSPRFAEILASLAEVADLVFIDSPPLLGLADASALAAQSDGVLLVVDPRAVGAKTLSQATEQLRKAGGQLLGTVLNAVVSEQGYGYYSSYYYYRHPKASDPDLAEPVDEPAASVTAGPSSAEGSGGSDATDAHKGGRKRA